MSHSRNWAGVKGAELLSNSLSASKRGNEINFKRFVET